MNRLLYFIKQGLENIFRNKIMFIASVLIVATSMITLSIFVLISENVKSIVENMQTQGVIVYLENDISEAQKNSVEIKLKTIQGIKKESIIYESKEEALENAKKEFFDESNMELTIGWEENNIFSPSFTVTLEELENVQEITANIANIDGVRKVDFDNEVFEMITKISDLVRVIVMGIFVLLVGISFLVISNTIKIVLHSRRREINIMKYIGATDGFVETPFIVEGVIVGTIGALISWGLSVWLYQAFVNTFSDFSFVVLNFEILRINLVIGILVSTIACAVSIRRYLKV